MDDRGFSLPQRPKDWRFIDGNDKFDTREYVTAMKWWKKRRKQIAINLMNKLKN